MKTFYKESKVVVEIYCEKNEIHLNERKKQSIFHCALFEVHITLGSRSEVSAFFVTEFIIIIIIIMSLRLSSRWSQPFTGSDFSMTVDLV
jgi:hypothetical protein